MCVFHYFKYDHMTVLSIYSYFHLPLYLWGKNYDNIPITYACEQYIRNRPPEISLKI